MWRSSKHNGNDLWEGSEGKSSNKHIDLGMLCRVLAWAASQQSQARQTAGSSPGAWQQHGSGCAALGPCLVPLLLGERLQCSHNLCGAARGGRLKWSVLLLCSWFIRQIKGEQEKRVNVLSVLSKTGICHTIPCARCLTARMWFNYGTAHW